MEATEAGEWTALVLGLSEHSRVREAMSPSNGSGQQGPAATVRHRPTPVIEQEPGAFLARLGAHRGRVETVTEAPRA